MAAADEKAEIARATEQASAAPLATLVITLSKAGVRAQGSAMQDPFFALGLIRLAEEIIVKKALSPKEETGIIGATTLPPPPRS